MVWIVLILPLISNSPFSIPNAMTMTIGVIVTSMILSFFSSQARSKCLFISLLSFSFYAIVHWNSQIYKMTIFFFLLLINNGTFNRILVKVFVILTSTWFQFIYSFFFFSQGSTKLFKVHQKTFMFSDCYCYYFTSCEFFTPVLIGSFSHKSELQKVFSSLQNFFKYSSWS